MEVLLNLGSSSISHVSGGEEEVRRLLEKIEKSALTDGDSDLEVMLFYV